MVGTGGPVGQSVMVAGTSRDSFSHRGPGDVEEESPGLDGQPAPGLYCTGVGAVPKVWCLGRGPFCLWPPLLGHRPGLQPPCGAGDYM